MKEFPAIVEGKDNSMELGVFILGIVKDPIQEGGHVTLKGIQEQFTGDTSQACALIALGIIRQNISNCKQSIIIHHKDTTIAFSEEYE